jgi:hypothetical protein
MERYACGVVNDSFAVKDDLGEHCVSGSQQGRTVDPERGGDAGRQGVIGLLAAAQRDSP